MDSEQLLEALSGALSEASEASEHAREVAREAGWAEQAADDAYAAINSIIDEVTAFSSINVDQHKAIVKLSYKVSNLSGYLHSLISDSVCGNSLSDKEEDSLRNISNILDRLFNFDHDTQVVLGFNKEFEVGYEYGTVSYTISPVVKEEASNV